MGANKSRYDVFKISNSADVNKYCTQNNENERKEVPVITIAGTVIANNDRDIREDSLIRARRERAEQGTSEIELSYGGEEDLRHHFKACQKNPGHQQFFRADQFIIGDLPPRYQDDEELMDFISSLLKLTVRVSVKHVSDKRPKTYPNTHQIYPCYDNSDKSLLRAGSGWISGVKKRFGKKGKIHCTCRDCQLSRDPEETFAEIYINTATVVVFDGIEGAHTTCHLFYNNDAALDKCQDVITLSGMSSVDSDIVSNTCLMTYVTHDMDLAERLLNIWQQGQTAHKTIMAKCSNDREKMLRASIRGFQYAEHTLAVIVSHPHGCSKHISVGDYTKRETFAPVYSQYTYSTATCPGCSGALVYVLGNSQLVFDHAHVGCREGVHRLGYSGYGLD